MFNRVMVLLEDYFMTEPILVCGDLGQARGQLRGPSQARATGWRADGRAADRRDPQSQHRANTDAAVLPSVSDQTTHNSTEHDGRWETGASWAGCGAREGNTSYQEAQR